MTVEDPSSLSSLATALLNRSGNTPLAVRFRALFALKALATEGSNEAVDIIAEGYPFPNRLLTFRLQG
jgi:deoxyhypusine monooxygenase